MARKYEPIPPTMPIMELLENLWARVQVLEAQIEAMHNAEMEHQWQA